MNILKIIDSQKYQRYKALMFLKDENHDIKKSLEKIMKKIDYEYLDIFKDLEKGYLNIEKIEKNKIEEIKKYFKDRNYSSDIVIIDNLEIILSMLSEYELEIFIEELKKDLYKPFNSEKLMIFILPQIKKFKNLKLKNEDNQISRIFKLEKIKF